MALDVTVPQRYRDAIVSFTAGVGTTAKLFIDEQQAIGNLLGDSRLLDAVVSSTDAASKDMIVWKGRVTTRQDAALTGVMTITATNTINRTTGSFVTDGWRVGDTGMLFAPVAGAANASDGLLVIVTGVTALALTCNTPVALINETLLAGTRLCEIAQLFTTQIPANAGNANAIPNVTLLNNTMDAAQDKAGMMVEADAVLALSMAAAVAALPARISVNGRLARY